MPITAAAPEPVGPAAPTPTAAVEGYIKAERNRDSRSSWALLSAGDRGDRTLAEWAAAAADRPQYRSESIVSADGAKVVVDVTMQPVVDQVIGIVPGAARETWTAVPEDGGWRVSLGEVATEPVLPDDAAATDVALGWLRDRQACTPLDNTVSLVGEVRAPEALCGRAGTFGAVSVGPLQRAADPAPVLDGYGPQAVALTRVVRVGGPGSLDVVTAPLGDRWVVIGLLPVT